MNYEAKLKLEPGHSDDSSSSQRPRLRLKNSGGTPLTNIGAESYLEGGDESLIDKGQQQHKRIETWNI